MANDKLYWNGEGSLKVAKGSTVKRGDEIPANALSAERVAFFQKKGLISTSPIKMVVNGDKELKKENRDLVAQVKSLKAENAKLESKLETRTGGNVELSNKVADLEKEKAELTKALEAAKEAAKKEGVKPGIFSKMFGSEG